MRLRIPFLCWAIPGRQPGGMETNEDDPREDPPPDAHSRLGPRSARTREPREYRIICLIRRDDGHLKALGYSENGNAAIYDGTWTIEEARQALYRGNRLYTVSPAGDKADLEYTNGRIRTKPHQTTDATLEDLPDCSRRGAAG